MEDTMDIYSPKGTKVRFSGKNGTDFDQEFARKYLVVGGLYTISRTEVGSFSSDAILAEFPHSRFNTVLFAPIEA